MPANAVIVSESQLNADAVLVSNLCPHSAIVQWRRYAGTHASFTLGIGGKYRKPEEILDALHWHKGSGTDSFLLRMAPGETRRFWSLCVWGKYRVFLVHGIIFMVFGVDFVQEGKEKVLRLLLFVCLICITLVEFLFSTCGTKDATSFPMCQPCVLAGFPRVM